MTRPENIDKTLNALFDAERTARLLHDQLIEAPREALLGAIKNTIQEAAELPDEDEASLRLVRVASLLGDLEGPAVVDALIDVISSEHDEARHSAGEELQALAFERFKEVAQGIERALTRLPADSPALAELPWVLADIPEPGVSLLLGQFLKHAEAEVVAEAVQVIAERGDPADARLLEPLRDDKRTFELEDDAGGDSAELTIGELVEEALELLEVGDDEAEESP